MVVAIPYQQMVTYLSLQLSNNNFFALSSVRVEYSCFYKYESRNSEQGTRVAVRRRTYQTRRSCLQRSLSSKAKRSNRVGVLGFLAHVDFTYSKNPS